MPHVCGSFSKNPDVPRRGAGFKQRMLRRLARFQSSFFFFLLQDSRCLSAPFCCVSRLPALVFLKAHLSQGLSSSAVRRKFFSWNKLRATHGLPFRAPVYRGCPSRKKPVCLRVQGDPEAKSQTVVVFELNSVVVVVEVVRDAVVCD